MDNRTSAQRAEIRQRFLAVDTANVADVLDTLGHLDQGLAPEFTPYPASVGKLAGWAYTIRGQMTPYPMGGDDRYLGPGVYCLSHPARPCGGSADTGQLDGPCDCPTAQV